MSVPGECISYHTLSQPIFSVSTPSMGISFFMSFLPAGLQKHI